MAWVESHQDIGQHPKTYALMAELNCGLATTVGLLHLLWHFTLKFAWRDGNLTKFSNEVIAQAVGWEKGKDPNHLITCLQTTGWLDKKKIHGWMQYAGKIVRDRIYNEERRNTALNGVSPRKSTATVPNQTLPNLTNKKIYSARVSFVKPTAQEVRDYAASIGFVLEGNKFVDYYEARGWKYNGGQSMKDWKAAVRTWHSKHKENNPNASDGIPSVYSPIAVARAKREAERLRKEAGPGEISPGIRDSADVQAPNSPYIRK